MSLKDENAKKGRKPEEQGVLFFDSLSTVIWRDFNPMHSTLLEHIYIYGTFYA